MPRPVLFVAVGQNICILGCATRCARVGPRGATILALGVLRGARCVAVLRFAQLVRVFTIWLLAAI